MYPKPRLAYVIFITVHVLLSVPSDSPVNVTVTAISPFAVVIEWRPPTTPNGIIVNYTVYANNGIIVIVNGSQTNYLYRGLSPYEEVNISVSASTKIGEGPRSRGEANMLKILPIILFHSAHKLSLLFL